MSEGLWLPGLMVLLAGLAGGILASWLLGRRDPSDGAERESDLELEIEDLDARREQLYRRLRGEAEESLSDADRERLELSAARVLHQLEEKKALLAGSRKPDRRPAAKKKKAQRGKKARRQVPMAAQSEAREAVASPSRGGHVGWAGRHPLLAGFTMGAGMVAVIAMLVYWAIRDARPQDSMTASVPPPAGTARGTAPEEFHDEGDELPITLAAELRALDERLAADPTDIAARKERALFNLRAERYFEAFDDAQALLANDPRDIDGLYVAGVVRLTMGQDELALGLFDQVLELFPGHVQAMVWKGIVQFRAGDRQAAVATWRQGLEAAGGSQPEIERLIETALSESPPAPAAAPAPAPTPAPPRQPPVDAPVLTADSFGLRIDLAPGAEAPAGAILFLSLRPAGGGPPIAVKKIDRPRFPLETSLGPGDSMMGQELPETGNLWARLDYDGSASTRGPEDLTAETEARRGEFVSLSLTGS